MISLISQTFDHTWKVLSVFSMAEMQWQASWQGRLVTEQHVGLAQPCTCLWLLTGLDLHFQSILFPSFGSGVTTLDLWPSPTPFWLFCIIYHSPGPRRALPALPPAVATLVLSRLVPPDWNPQPLTMAGSLLVALCADFDWMLIIIIRSAFSEMLTMLLHSASHLAFRGSHEKDIIYPVFDNQGNWGAQQNRM